MTTTGNYHCDLMQRYNKLKRLPNTPNKLMYIIKDTHKFIGNDKQEHTMISYYENSLFGLPIFSRLQDANKFATRGEANKVVKVIKKICKPVKDIQVIESN